MDDKTKKVDIEKRRAEIMKEVDDNLDKFETIIKEANEAKSREWIKGFAVGYGSAVVGFAVAGFVVKAVYKSK